MKNKKPPPPAHQNVCVRIIVKRKYKKKIQVYIHTFCKKKNKKKYFFLKINYQTYIQTNKKKKKRKQINPPNKYICINKFIIYLIKIKLKIYIYTYIQTYYKIIIKQKTK